MAHRPTAGMCEWGFIDGPIVSGDYDKVLAVYRRNL